MWVCLFIRRIKVLKSGSLRCRDERVSLLIPVFECTYVCMFFYGSYLGVQGWTFKDI